MIVEVYTPSGQKIAAYPINAQDERKKTLTPDQITQIGQSLAVQDGICNEDNVNDFRFLARMG